MKLVVLGGTGFVGKHLLKALAEREDRHGQPRHEIVVPSRAPFQHREASLIPRVRVVAADVYNQQALQNLLTDADAVINLVGILNESGRNGKGFERAHVELMETLIAACKASGCRRLLQMSALNAGQGESHYLRTKGDAERLLENSGLAFTIFQPSVIFGSGDDFLNRFATLLKLAPVLPLACADSRFEPVYVGDVVRAFVQSLEDPNTIGKRFSLCGPRSYSLRKLVEFTAEAMGLKRRVLGIPDVLARLQARVFDFVPGKPFSTDNYKSLQVDSVCGRNGLGYFNISPRSVEAIAPSYLTDQGRQGRYRNYRSAARR